MEQEVGSDAIGRTRELLERFLADRGDRTLQAYTADLDDFGRFVGRDTASAVAQLLGGSQDGSSRLLLDYAVDQRRRGRAQATVQRRLYTLRGLWRMAHDAGFAEWPPDIPEEHQIAAEMEARSAPDVPYLFPRHPSEVDRLDIQHYVLREVLGANYLAPIKAPTRVLDVGCGTGQWGFEVCRQFPGARVIGLDLVSGKPEQPSRYHWVRGNLLEGLPFPPDQFDFVHQRLLVAGVPRASWPAVVADLVRVTRPGGWVELVDGPLEVERGGPATDRIRDLTREMLSALGLDTTGVVFDSLDGYLRQAGLASVVRRQVSVPIGRWGGRVGSLMVTDLRAASTRVSEVLRARDMLSPEEAGDVIRQAQEEWEHGQMFWNCAIVYGQKPA